jgi:hypothetical protein
MQSLVCSGCGTPIIEDTPAGLRRPCPRCGSLGRTENVSVAETIHVQEYLKTHTKHRDGGRKVVREVIEGDDYYRKTGKWNVMRRLIDRGKNWYEESFLDRDSGEIVHRNAEPLSKHRQKPREN